MCILFLYINPKPSAGQFRLVLAANRDEAYKRPSKYAHFWEEDKTVIGGRDMEPGKEGGSWLALSTRGRIAALLNIMHLGDHPPELLGRGTLVSNFVKGSLTGHEYLNKIAVNNSKYRPFNFLTVHIKPNNIDVCEYSNVNRNSCPRTVNREYLGISNSLLDRPFVKVTAGIEQFRNIITKYGDTEKGETLSSKLLEFLKHKDSYFPDPEMISYSPSTPTTELKQFSSVYVSIPHKEYGTRAHSIITLDYENQVNFNEWALQEPIEPLQPQWICNKFQCKLYHSNENKGE